MPIIRFPVTVVIRLSVRNVLSWLPLSVLKKSSSSPKAPPAIAATDNPHDATLSDRSLPNDVPMNGVKIPSACALAGAADTNITAKATDKTHRILPSISSLQRDEDAPFTPFLLVSLTYSTEHG
jgi:hypothetical protein